jgi:predicted ATP-grasp superfamily ATP-dependent carboligase
MNAPETPPRHVVVFGMLHAGLAFARSFGRAGIPVSGLSLHAHEFGLRSRFLRHRYAVTEREGPGRDTRVLDALRFLASESPGGRVVLFPERDENVAFILDHWDEVRELADFPLPQDPDAVLRLRRKERLAEEAARAGVPAPATVLADCAETVAGAGLRPPFLVKPVEGQEFALHFGKKAAVAQTVDEACAVWRAARDAGFETLVQELIPDSHERVFSLLAYIAQNGEPLACVVGRKVRQGPLRFGTSAFFEVNYDRRVLEQGLRLLTSAAYRGIAHVEFAHDRRDDTFKLLEVNTRPPVWVGIAVTERFDIARLAYDDLTGNPPLACRLFRDELSWMYLAKDVWVSYQMARRGELRLGELASHYLRRGKVHAVFAADDPLPALASLNYLRSRL